MYIILETLKRNFIFCDILNNLFGLEMNSVNVDFIVEFNGRKQKFKFTRDADPHRVETVLQNLVLNFDLLNICYNS